MERALAKAQKRAEEKFEHSEDEDEESSESSLEDTRTRKIRRKLGKNIITSYQEWMEMRLREIHELHKPMDYQALRKYARGIDRDREERRKRNERELREK